MKKENAETFTVSQVNQRIGRSLQEAFPDPFWVAGEVQGYERDAAKGATRRWGQVYFELIEKEKHADSAKASVKALVWGDALAQIAARLQGASDRLSLRDGVQVRFLCAVDFYWPRASLQLKVLDVDPEFTLGDLERAKQELVRALKEEGLFDSNRERDLPPVPQTVGLITSEGSAAYHDFVEELKSSGYAFDVRLWDARMQGEETEASVCRGLEVLGSMPEVDVIALVRGGGSRSDLIWFDKEKIARAVAGCAKPVVTGIGHEIDLSVADLVARESRKTPTAAARFLIERLGEFEVRLAEAARGLRQGALETLAEGRRDLAEALNAWRQSASILIQRHRADLASAAQGLVLGVRRHIDLGKQDLARLPGELAARAREVLRRENERLEVFRKECGLKDPRRLLARGYSLVTVGGKLVKSVEQAREGLDVEAQVADGFISAKVISKRKVNP